MNCVMLQTKGPLCNNFPINNHPEWATAQLCHLTCQQTNNAQPHSNLSVASSSSWVFHMLLGSVTPLWNKLWLIQKAICPFLHKSAHIKSFFYPLCYFVNIFQLLSSVKNNNNHFYFHHLELTFIDVLPFFSLSISVCIFLCIFYCGKISQHECYHSNHFKCTAQWH